ncbi:MAG: hypothetical protein AAF437_12230 [Pseudomonadota bacterium]
MDRITANPSQIYPQVSAAFLHAGGDVNALDVDEFVTPELTPKKESRRGWRRRRIRRGKS